MFRRLLIAGVLCFGLVLPIYSRALSRLTPNSQPAIQSILPVPSQPTTYEFVEHVIDQVRTCEGNPLQVRRTIAQTNYDFTFTSGTEVGCTAVTIPNGRLAINFPAAITSGVAFTPSINTTGTLQLRVASNHFTVSGKGLTVDAVLNRLPIREDPGVHQDLRNVPCPLARFRQNPPLNGGTEAVPGLNPFSRDASCTVTAPVPFQSFEGDVLLIISTVDIVVGEDPIGPANFFSYRGIRLLRFTVTSKYRPFTCPGFQPDSNLAGQTQCPAKKLSVTVPSPVKAGQTPFPRVTVEAQNLDGTLDTAFNGTVQVNVDPDSTPNIGCLRATGRTDCATTIPVELQGGKMLPGFVIALQTPKTELTTQTVIKLQTNDPPLKGEVRISAQSGTVVGKAIVNVESPLNLGIKEIEVQQGVRQVVDLPLVLEREMLVRVFLEHNKETFNTFARIEGIKARLTVKDGAGVQIGAPIEMKKWRIDARADDASADFVFVRGAIEREDGSDTLNHRLNGTVETKLNFLVELDDTIPDFDKSNNSKPYGTVHLYFSRPLTIKYAKLRILASGPSLYWAGIGTQLPRQEGIDRSVLALKYAYPIAWKEVKDVYLDDDVRTTNPFIGDPLNTFVPTFLDSSGLVKYVYFVDKTYFLNIRKVKGGRGYTRTSPSGKGEFSIVNADLCSDNPVDCLTLSHEVGHTFGLGDTYIADDAKPSPNNKRNDPPDANDHGNFIGPGHYSWFHGKFTSNASVPFIDFMGNEAPSWGDLKTWKHLQSKLLFAPSQRAAPIEQNQVGTFVLVRGKLAKNGSATFDNFYTRIMTNPGIGAGAGSHVVETVDAGGIVLNSLSFDPDFVLPHSTIELADVAFGQILPFSTAVRQIRLRVGTSILASRTVTAAVPTVSFVSNFSGQTLTGTQQVSWNGSDTDGGPLSYTLLYSPDATTNLMLVQDTTATSFAWNTDKYPSGSSPKLSLIASDGVNTTYIDSQPFIIPNRAPLITILSPGSQFQFKTGQQIAFSGSLNDPEEGLSQNPQLQWSSSIQGSLGTGKDIALTNLSTGTHVITASGADTLGKIGTATVTIIVRPDNFSHAEVSQANLDFGTIPVGDTAESRFLVQNKGNIALTVSSIVSSSSRFQVLTPAAPFVVQPRSHIEITVRFTPLSADSQSGGLTVGCNASNRSSIAVALSGNGMGATAGSLASVSAANFVGTTQARDGIVAAFGLSLATTLQLAATVPLPTEMAGTTVTITDSAGNDRLAPLFFVSPMQINYLIPPETATGQAIMVVRSGDGKVSIGNTLIADVAPGVFTANSDGRGVPAAFAIRVKSDGTQITEAVLRFDPAQGKFVPSPIDFGPPGDQIVLALFGTGWRHRSSLSDVTVLVDGIPAEVGYAGPQGDFVGLDQVNITLPRSLTGHGEVDLVLSVAGQANTVRVAFAAPACTFNVAPLSQNFNASGGVGSVNVQSGTGCAWNAVSNATWIAITSGSPGNGPGTLNYFVSANSTAQRSGTLMIAGQTFTVTQSAGTLTVLGRRTTLGPIPADCADPGIKTAFLTTDARLYQWTLVTGAHIGDQVRWEFSPVSGSVVQTVQYSVPTEGNLSCFWASLEIAGAPPSTMPGNWQVRVFYNNALLFTDNFTISAGLK